MIIIINGPTSPLLDPGRLFCFRILYTDGRSIWMGDQSSLGFYQVKDIINRINALTFMPRVEFEPAIPSFEWKKTVHALDSAATVIGSVYVTERSPETALKVYVRRKC
jgi:hypothetical protein